MGSSAPSPAIAALCLAVSACFVDNMGAASTTAETTGVLTTTAAPTSTPDPTTSTTADTTTGADECADFKVTLLVEDAAVTPPMIPQKTRDEGIVARSEESDEGTVEFKFMAPCAGTYDVWGRVLDQNPGPKLAVDPDSFTARVDGGPEVTWHYGCTTADIDVDWSWQRVQSLADDDDDCDTAALWRLDLTAGEHAITLRNIEDAFLDEHAAVARILVTNDPGDTPTNE
jgi:hypothetical protein